MNAQQQRIILCEGYHDRAFWDGWLRTARGCAAPQLRPDGSREPWTDPWGKKVQGGQFGFRSPSGIFLRTVPCHGETNILREARIKLAQRTTNALPHLVVTFDLDEPDGSPLVMEKARANRLQSLESLVQQVDPNYDHKPPADFMIDGGKTRISLVLWEAADPTSPELPTKQTLERLVVAALRATYPDRGPSVERWLSTRPYPPAPGLPGPKAYAWSYMAGWYEDRGCEAFYSTLWDDSQWAEHVRNRLASSGALAIMNEVAL